MPSEIQQNLNLVTSCRIYEEVGKTSRIKLILVDMKTSKTVSELLNINSK